MPFGGQGRAQCLDGFWPEAIVDEILGTAPVDHGVADGTVRSSWNQGFGAPVQRIPSGSTIPISWSVFAPLGVTCGITSELQPSADNVHGRSIRSPACSRRAAGRPPRPADTPSIQKSLHLLSVQRSLGSEGTPVGDLGSPFLSWQAFAGMTLECRLDDHWLSVLGDLEVVGRAFREVDCSGLSAEFSFETPSLPMLEGYRLPVFRVTRFWSFLVVAAAETSGGSANENATSGFKARVAPTLRRSTRSELQDVVQASRSSDVGLAPTLVPILTCCWTLHGRRG